MKLKLDENFGMRAIELFRDAGHDTLAVYDQGLGGTPDADLIEVCREEGRALVTLDLDFSNALRFPPALYAGVAVLRIPNPVTPDALQEHVGVLLRAMEERNLVGRLWIVELGRVRVRPDRLATLDRIAARAQSADQKDRAFGPAVVEHLPRPGVFLGWGVTVTPLDGGRLKVSGAFIESGTSPDSIGEEIPVWAEDAT